MVNTGFNTVWHIHAAISSCNCLPSSGAQERNLGCRWRVRVNPWMVAEAMEWMSSTIHALKCTETWRKRLFKVERIPTRSARNVGGKSGGRNNLEVKEGRALRHFICRWMPLKYKQDKFPEYWVSRWSLVTLARDIPMTWEDKHRTRRIEETWLKTCSKRHYVKWNTSQQRTNTV